MTTGPATRSAAAVFAVRAVGLAINLAGALALARALGPDGRGAQALFTVGSFGLALLLMVGASTGGYVLVTRGFDTAAIGAAALAHGLGAGLALFGAAVLAPRIQPLGSVPGWPVPLALAVGGLVANGHHVLLALARGRAVLGASLSVTPYAAAAVAYVVAALSGRLSLATAVWAFAIGPIAALVVAAWPRLRLGIVTRTRPSASVAMAMARAGIRGSLADLFTALHQRIDVLLLGALAPLASTGIYVAAYQSVEPLWALLSGGAVVAMAGQPATGGRRASSSSTPMLVRQTMLLAGLLALTAALALPPLVPLLYGQEFAAARLPLLLLLPGVAAYAIGRVACADLVRGGNLGRNAQLAGIALAGNVTMNLVLIPPFGATGAALASLCSYTLYAGLALSAYTRASGTGWPELIPRPSDLAALTDLARTFGRPAPRAIGRSGGRADRG